MDEVPIVLMLIGAIVCSVIIVASFVFVCNLIRLGWKEFKRR